MWIIIIILIIFVSISYVIYISKHEIHQKIFNTYSRPGKLYWLKYFLFLTFLEAKKINKKILNFINMDENVDDRSQLFHMAEEITKWEKLQPLSDHEKAFDAVSFQGINWNGYYFCGSTERRHGAKTLGYFYILVPGLGLLRNIHLPNTVLETNPVSIYFQNSYSAEGIAFTPTKPMNLWKISYKGKMKLVGDEKNDFDVKLEAEWVSDNPFFYFEQDINNKALAKAISREAWRNDYFKTLELETNTHYEQFGKIRGTLIINSNKHELKMESCRDHGFGYKRDWSMVHRYVLYKLYLNNGIKISVGVISYPTTMSHIEVGYVINKNKTLETIESCDLKLYQHGENGNPGKNLAFSFKAGKNIYVVKTMIDFEAEHIKGHNNEGRFIERFLKCDVNGVKGKGIAEWFYNIGKRVY